MHKQYPYLQNSFVYQTDIERQKRDILKEIDSFVNQRQYIKITLLNWDEEPIKEIEGEISSGSISKVGDSPIRRTAQLTCAVDARSYSVDDGKADFAINKKVFIEIGVKNETPHYSDYPIFWFPEGVFFIGSFSINAGANSSTTITLGLKDKMAMLNGDVGGTLPASVIFDSMDTQLPTGEYVERKVLIYNIIKELVNHYGGEDLNRIVIEGVPLRIRRIMQWIGDVPLYQISTGENYNIGTEIKLDSDDGSIKFSKENVSDGGSVYYEYTTEEPTSNNVTKFEKGDDVGYIMDDFVIMDELVGAPGESVTSILDKIKNILGNYEYFYDVFGVFHFREIKNYYVTTQARDLLDEMVENDYLVETNNSRSIYTFDDEKLLTSITVNPQYENIKNDYIIQGETTIGDSDIVYPVRYHLAIDNKPTILGQDNRQTVRQLVNNDDEIAGKEQELKQLTQQKYNNSMDVEEALYNINRAKSNLQIQYDYVLANDRDIVQTIASLCGFNYKEADLLSDEYPEQLMQDKLIKAIKEYQPVKPINYNEEISLPTFNEYEFFAKRQESFNKSDSNIQTFDDFMEQFIIEEEVINLTFCKDIDYNYNMLSDIVNMKNIIPSLVEWIQQYQEVSQKIQNQIEKWELEPYDLTKKDKDSSAPSSSSGKEQGISTGISSGSESIISTDTDNETISEENNVDIPQELFKETETEPLEENVFIKIMSLKDTGNIFIRKDTYEEITNEKLDIDIDVINRYIADNTKLYLIEPIKEKIKEESKLTTTDNDSNILDSDLKNLVQIQVENFQLLISLNNICCEKILELQNQCNILNDLVIQQYKQKWAKIYDYLKSQNEMLIKNKKQYEDIKIKLLGDAAISIEGSSQEPVPKWYVNNYNVLIEMTDDNKIKGFSDYITYIDMNNVTEEKNSIAAINARRLEENCTSLWEILDYIYNKQTLQRLLDDNNYTIDEIWKYFKELYPENTANSLEDLYNKEQEEVDSYNKFDIEKCINKLRDNDPTQDYRYVYETNGQKKYQVINIENNQSFYQYYKYNEDEPTKNIKSLIYIFWDKFNKYNNTNEGSNAAKIAKIEQDIKDLQNKNYTFTSIDNPRPNENYYGIYPTSQQYCLVFYTHPRNNIPCAAYCQTVGEEDFPELPEIGNFNLIYCTKETSKAAAGEYLYWDGQMYKPVEILGIYDNDNLYYAYDWRTKLYLDGLEGVLHGTDKGYYYEELAAFWPQVYDIVEQKFFGEKDERPSWFKTLAAKGIYYLDFLDAIGTSFGEWSVDNIGRRSDVIVKEEVNCLFQPEIPNVILLPSNGVLDFNVWQQDTYRSAYQGKDLESTWTLADLRKEAIDNHYPWTQISSDIYSKLITGGYKNAAFDEIKYELYLHTRYQKTVSLTSIPVFYLEPNSRITINDTTTNTYGDFIVQSINLTLGPGANMSVSCNEAAERF